MQFLHHLAATGHVRRACARVGVSAQAAYVYKRRDAAFAAGWDAALVLARDAAEDLLAERALEGTHETIFYRGEAVGTRVRFDARLLLAHLARLDKHHAEATGVQGIAARFDEYLGELLEGEASGEGPEFLVPLEESEPPEPTQWHPARPTREEALLAAREAALYDMPEDLADLSPETLEAFEAEELDEADRWSFAVATAQEAASTAAAEAWDAETAARHAQIDALCHFSPNAFGEGDHPQGGGGCNPEPPYETKALKSSGNFPLITVSTVSTCRRSQQFYDIVFPFGSPARSAKRRREMAPSPPTRQEHGPCYAALSPLSRLLLWPR